MNSRMSLAALLSSAAGMLGAGMGCAETFAVTSAADDGAPGTLRWAIERNNTSPGGHRIEIRGTAAGPLLIAIGSVLPPVRGPVVIAVVGLTEGTTGPGVAG